MYKSFGAGDSRNPMKIRVGDYGLGAVLLAGDHVREYPLENAILFTEFGVAQQTQDAGGILAAVGCAVTSSAQHSAAIA